MHLRTRLVCFEIYTYPLKKKVHELFLQKIAEENIKATEK